MSTIGDLVNGNPFYEKGVFLDRDYYKHQIPATRFQEAAPSPAALRKALIQESCILIASQVLLIGCVLVPSIYTLGMAVALPAMGSAVLFALMTYDLEGKAGTHDDPTATGWIRGTYFKRSLLAALPRQEQSKYLAHTAGWDTALKTAFLGIRTLAPQTIARTFAYAGIFFATYQLTVELEKLALLGIKIYAEQAAARKLQPSPMHLAPAST